MVDKISKEKRSEIMRSIRSKDTKPEMVVRKLLTNLGYRYRLHRKEILGKPDIVFIGRKKAIFVHGCFWHGHENCKKAKIPEIEFWQKKIRRNIERDSIILAKLDSLGWKTIIIWECELKNITSIQERLVSFLQPIHIEH